MGALKASNQFQRFPAISASQWNWVFVLLQLGLESLEPPLVVGDLQLGIVDQSADEIDRDGHSAGRHEIESGTWWIHGRSPRTGRKRLLGCVLLLDSGNEELAVRIGPGRPIAHRRSVRRQGSVVRRYGKRRGRRTAGDGNQSSQHRAQAPPTPPHAHKARPRKGRLPAVPATSARGVGARRPCATVEHSSGGRRKVGQAPTQ